MKAVQPVFGSLLLLFSTAVIPSLAVYIDNTDLGPHYPFVVHPPSGTNPPANPPLLFFLHGAGSRGPDPSTNMHIDVLVEWNGPGRRLREYNAGNITDSSRIVAEQFLTVLPVAPLTDDRVPEWDIPALFAVYQKVQSLYTFDQNRVYLSGYSFGARDAWQFLTAHPEVFAAAAISAGEPPNGTDFSAIINIPIHHYAGTQDFEGSSNLGVANRTQRNIEAAGSTKCELEVVNGPYPAPAHNAMANAPFFEPMFSWLLSNTKDGSPVPASTTTSSSLPTSTTTTGSQVIPTGNTLPTSTSTAGPAATTTAGSSGALRVMAGSSFSPSLLSFVGIFLGGVAFAFI